MSTFISAITLSNFFFFFCNYYFLSPNNTVNRNYWLSQQKVFATILFQFFLSTKSILLQFATILFQFFLSCVSQRSASHFERDFMKDKRRNTKKDKRRVLSLISIAHHYPTTKAVQQQQKNYTLKRNNPNRGNMLVLRIF